MSNEVSLAKHRGRRIVKLKNQICELEAALARVRDILDQMRAEKGTATGDALHQWADRIEREIIDGRA